MELYSAYSEGDGMELSRTASRHLKIGRPTRPTCSAAAQSGDTNPPNRPKVTNSLWPSGLTTKRSYTIFLDPFSAIIRLLHNRQLLLSECDTRSPTRLQQGSLPVSLHLPR